MVLKCSHVNVSCISAQVLEPHGLLHVSDTLLRLIRNTSVRTYSPPGGRGGGGAGGGSLTVQQPVQAVLNVTTTVSVPDGGTVLLGGVKRLKEGRNMAGVPILNKIPYISRLFKNSGVGRDTESVMLMVTPRIIIQEEEEELLGIPPE